ncbi:hypothetical protein NLJ89_g212 [Agrocybe chaxingu]|uniref:Uncharacterized protein n=1 Tax=Agrocybe chaxingu TaxID=84603 RepID=A0A9W8N2A8_9AGAR|nr:hypothetical protein NLJ89_g212 [Agrocybe chaxingu]
MENALARHLPLITQRIEFTAPRNAGLPPVITPRIDFNTLWMEPLDTDTATPPMSRETSVLTESDNNSQEENASQDNEDGDDANGINKKIPKPAGEPGRPHSGGYNLENELQGWAPDLFTNINKFVKQKADAHLDTTISYSRQKPSEVTAVCLMVKKTIPNCRQISELLACERYAEALPEVYNGERKETGQCWYKKGKAEES